MDNPLAPSPYDTLNVAEDATLAAIRIAHRKLVLSCHPDREPDESAKKEKAEQFHQVQQAYEILSDEDRRQRYDHEVNLAERRAEAAEERISFLSQKSYDQASHPSYSSIPPLKSLSASSGYSASSNVSNDSGYVTGTPSANSATTKQSDPIQSRIHSLQLAFEQTIKLARGNQRSPDAEPVCLPPISSSGLKLSEYPCLHPNCGHISSRAHDLKRHMTVHFPPAVEELLDCKYEWCGRTGNHGFKREDHRKEHYRMVHMFESECPNGKVRKKREGRNFGGWGVGRGSSSAASTNQTSAVLKNQNLPIHIKRTHSIFAASEEGLPLSSKLQTPEPSTTDVAQLGKPQPPKIYETPANEKTAGLKFFFPDSDSVMPEGNLDDLGTRIESEHRHPTEMVFNRNEMLISSMSRDTTEDKMATISSQVLGTLLVNKAGQYCASLTMKWDILGFMEDQFRENDFPNKALAPIITISGSAKHAQATTCSEYTKRNWPAYGSKVLEALQEALDSSSHRSRLKNVARCDGGSVSIDDAPSNHAELEVFIIHKYFILDIRFGTPDMIVDVVQQLAWMGAALRTSRDGQVQHCISKLEGEQFERMDPAIFNITFDLSSPDEEDQSCWFPLFLNPVIAHGFPTPHRNHNEVGLEIPLEIMAALGGARHVVDFEGGLVLKGYSTLFVPIKCHEGSIQWHLIRATGGDRIPYHEASVQCPNRALLKDLNHEALITARIYLGWWPHAEIHLGTADADYKSIDWSHAGGTRRPTRLSGANIGFQTIVTGQLNFTPGAKDGNLHFSHKKPFQKIVQLAQETPVTLYDLRDRRAWLSPALNVMLHIIQTRHHLSPYTVDGEHIELAPVSPKYGRGAATEAVAANQLRQLYERDVATEKGYYFKDAILDIWSQIDGMMEKGDSIEENSGLVLHGTMQSKLCGWEFMSLVHEKNFRRKEVTIAKTSGGWVDLINDIDGLVLFTNGFGEIIRPVSDLDNLCRRWKSLPTEKDYLAAGVPLLELLYSEAGSRESRKHLSSNRLQWNRGPTLFERCRDTASLRCKCDRTQQIYHDSLFKTFGHVRPPGNLHNNGCVIFGQAQHPFIPSRTIAIRHNAVHKLPNVSIQNDESTKQVGTEEDGLSSTSPSTSVSSEPEEVDGYPTRSLKSPPSPLSFSDDLAEEEAVALERRCKMSHVQTSNFDTCQGLNIGDDKTCPTEDQSTIENDALSNGQYSGDKQTACASEAEFEYVHARRTIRRKAKIEDYSHRRGCSCTTCSIVDFELPDNTELVNSTNGTQRNSTTIVERRQRRPV